MIPEDQWEWFGKPGHLCVGNDCRFHLCTLVGPWLVSTVGEYIPPLPVLEIQAKVRGVKVEDLPPFTEIGWQRLYETMVFHSDHRCTKPGCNCGVPQPSRLSELDADGYNTAGDAHAGHYTMCRRWANVGEETLLEIANDLLTTTGDQ